MINDNLSGPPTRTLPHIKSINNKLSPHHYSWVYPYLLSHCSHLQITVVALLKIQLCTFSLYIDHNIECRDQGRSYALMHVDLWFLHIFGSLDWCIHISLVPAFSLFGLILMGFHCQGILLLIIPDEEITQTNLRSWYYCQFKCILVTNCPIISLAATLFYSKLSYCLTLVVWTTEQVIWKIHQLTVNVCPYMTKTWPHSDQSHHNQSTSSTSKQYLWSKISWINDFSFWGMDGDLLGFLQNRASYHLHQSRLSFHHC